MRAELGRERIGNTTGSWTAAAPARSPCHTKPQVLGGDCYGSKVYCSVFRPAAQNTTTHAITPPQLLAHTTKRQYGPHHASALTSTLCETPSASPVLTFLPVFAMVFSTFSYGRSGAATTVAVWVSSETS